MRWGLVRRLAVVVAVVMLLVALWVVASSQGDDNHIALRCGQNSRVHPQRCLVAGVSGAAGVFVYLVRLSWSNWGAPKARANGFVHDPERRKSSAVSVLVYGRQSCEGADYYRWLRLGSGGRTKLRLRMSCMPPQP